VAWCAKELGVEVSYKKLYDWFRRWGYRKKVPRLMAEKADHQVQEGWKKEAVGSLVGGGDKARDMGPCGFSQGEGGGRGGCRPTLLNPVERILEEVRRWAEGRSYKRIEAKQAAVKRCYDGWKPRGESHRW
jgi:hypothetical protein